VSRRCWKCGQDDGLSSISATWIEKAIEGSQQTAKTKRMHRCSSKAYTALSKAIIPR